MATPAGQVPNQVEEDATQLYDQMRDAADNSDWRLAAKRGQQLTTLLSEHPGELAEFERAVMLGWSSYATGMSRSSLGDHRAAIEQFEQVADYVAEPDPQAGGWMSFEALNQKARSYAALKLHHRAASSYRALLCALGQQSADKLKRRRPRFWFDL